MAAAADYNPVILPTTFEPADVNINYILYCKYMWEPSFSCSISPPPLLKTSYPITKISRFQQLICYLSARE